MKTKSKGFRAVPKAAVHLKMPPALLKRVRRRALDRGQTLTHAATEAFAAWVGVDPSQFGIDPADSPK